MDKRFLEGATFEEPKRVTPRGLRDLDRSTADSVVQRIGQVFALINRDEWDCIENLDIALEHADIHFRDGTSRRITIPPA